MPGASKTQYLMKKLFTFGCSFTNYHWPTWADILGRDFDYYENWGQTGGGNPFIFYSLIECLRRNQIQNSDTIIVMWSSNARLDYYADRKWITHGHWGNVPLEKTYQKKIAEINDDRGYLLRDALVIDAAKRLLDSLGVKYIFLSMVPFDLKNAQDHLENQDILEFFKDAFDSVRPSVYELIFNLDWNSRPFLIQSKIEKKTYESVTEKFYDQIKGVEWPSFEKFVKRDYAGVKQEVITEIEKLFRDDLLKKLSEEERINKKLVKKSKFSTWWGVRIDPHPTPDEHLEYITKALPEFTLSENTLEFVKICEGYVRAGESLSEFWQPCRPKRL
jgi:hypothetical protein